MDEPVAPVPDKRLLPWLLGGASVLAVLILLLWKMIFVLIMPGQVGVLYSVLFGGTVTSWTHGEGLALKLPWDRIYVMERRNQAPVFTVHGFSREGMPVEVEAVLFFQLRPEYAPRVLMDMGSDYATRFLVPLAQGAVREVLSRYNSHDLYTVEYKRLYDDLMGELIGAEHPYRRYFASQDISIRRLDLPAEIVAAIQRKLTAEQEAAAYRFHLDRQRQEAERLRIEATGLRTYNTIVQESLTDRLLTWRGIEATVQLARSSNAKVVIVGGHRDQLPLILGGDLGAVPAPTQTDPGPPATARAAVIQPADGATP